MLSIKSYVAVLTAFVLLDGLWLVLVGSAFFKSQLGALLRAQPDLIVAALFYLIYAGGLTALAVAPSMNDRSLWSAARRGAILGVTAYATFDLTNLAILKGWTATVAVVDVIWGTAASALASLAACFVGLRSIHHPRQGHA